MCRMRCAIGGVKDLKRWRTCLQGKLYTEDLLQRRGVNWTSVRPVYIYVSRVLWMVTPLWKT